VKPAGGLEALNEVGEAGDGVVGAAGGSEVGAAGASVDTIESDEEVVEPEPLVAVTVKVEVPAAVGVPDRAPAEDRVTPAGSEPEATV
jgi:hypothetical protein